jgi:hypothetical protein
MNKAQEEICDELILHANNRTEVFNVMITTFKDLNERNLREYIADRWKAKIPGNRVSLSGLSYKEKVTVIADWFEKRDLGKIKHIYAYINKGLSKSTPYDFYLELLGANAINAERRSLQRGEKVELLGFDKYQMRLEVADLKWIGYTFEFLVWDINARKYIEIE